VRLFFTQETPTEYAPVNSIYKGINENVCTSSRNFAPFDVADEVWGCSVACWFKHWATSNGAKLRELLNTFSLLLLQMLLSGAYSVGVGLCKEQS
jgi:hypothetical protein